MYMNMYGCIGVVHASSGLLDNMEIPYFQCMLATHCTSTFLIATFHPQLQVLLIHYIVQ